MAEHGLHISATVTNHSAVIHSRPTNTFTMVDTDAITMVLMGLGCLVLGLCVLLATILIYQHCR